MSTRRRVFLGVLALAVLALGIVFVLRPKVGRSFQVGSKEFTEGVILGEVIHLLLVGEGIPAEHDDGKALGGSRIVYDALRAGKIDAYVDYTGTIQREILGDKGPASLDVIEKGLAADGVTLGPGLGFNNTYDLGMRRARAAELGIEKISDLRDHPDLVLGLTHEFREREDGWPGLQRRYGLPQKDVRGLDHRVAYEAIAAGQVDVVDVYSTDAKIVQLDLVTLEDDLGFFPTYDAVILYRSDLAEKAPQAVRTLALLRDTIDEERMSALNAAVTLDDKEEGAVAASFLERRLGRFVVPVTETRLERLWKHTREHLGLVGVSLLLAILVGVALGILAAKTGAFGQAVIGVVGAAQTIPGIALLVLFVPVFGIGWLPTVIALVVYSLLPIVRNTHAGLTGIARPLRESALVLGLPDKMRLTQVELPLAAPSILAGIKTAAVWNVALATLGALIGAGGYGEPILAGLRKNDTGLILEGAVPAIVLALLVQVLFDQMERVIVSPGLRYGHDR